MPVSTVLKIINRQGANPAVVVAGQALLDAHRRWRANPTGANQVDFMARMDAFSKLTGQRFTKITK